MTCCGHVEETQDGGEEKWCIHSGVVMPSLTGGGDHPWLLIRVLTSSGNTFTSATATATTASTTKDIVWKVLDSTIIRLGSIHYYIVSLEIPDSSDSGATG